MAIVKESVTLYGFEGFEEMLRQLPPEVAKKIAEPALRKGAVLVQKEAQARAPIRSGESAKVIRGKRSKGARGRLPGFLKASILIRINRAAAATAKAAAVYSVGWSREAFYGMFQEFGTRHQAAKPFLRPALEAKAEEAISVIGADMGPKIEEAARKFAASKR